MIAPWPGKFFCFVSDSLNIHGAVTLKIKKTGRRQRIVMERALASGAIVSSLFPEKVKQQLYEEHKQDHKAETLKGFFANNDSASAMSSKPIADLFPETTVLFADIVGK